MGGVGEDVETISLRAFGDAAVVGGVKRCGLQHSIFNDVMIM